MCGCFSASSSKSGIPTCYNSEALPFIYLSSKVMRMARSRKMGEEEWVAVKKLVESGIERVPRQYVRPEEQRPDLSTLDYADELPVIDMAHLSGGQHHHRLSALQAIRRACQDSGFFYVKNHGIPLRLSRNMMAVSREFFDGAAEEKMKYFTTDASAPARYGTSFNSSVDNVLNWRDFLRLTCVPDLHSALPFWPDTPPALREVAAEYVEQTQEVYRVMLGAVLESLGLPAKYIEETYGSALIVQICNYYPACPNPELTLGLAGHSDPGWLTIVNSHDQVGGLQIFKDNRWLRLRPTCDALVLNLADQMEILSNGQYKSVEHRVVVNSDKERLSLATGFSPQLEKTVQPASPLIAEERARYNTRAYGEYFSTLYHRPLNGKAGLRSQVTFA